MTGQWESECISLSVLSLAWVMIAQWENECISLSVLFMARVMVAQWEHWEDECIALSAHSVTLVQVPGMAEDFSLADCILPTKNDLELYLPVLTTTANTIQIATEYRDESLSKKSSSPCLSRRRPLLSASINPDICNVKDKWLRSNKLPTLQPLIYQFRHL